MPFSLTILSILFILIDASNSAAITVNGVSNAIGCTGTTLFSNSTCAPKNCVYVTNSACTSTSTVTDLTITTTISNQNCNSTCTPSSDSRCTAASIASIFSKGINGVNSIKAMYCTDKYLIIQSNGMPNHNDSLAYIPRPPGGGGGGSYSTSCVTRSHVIQSFTWRIPLNPVALSTASASVNNVASFNTGSMLLTAALPADGPSGVTITGLPIYPPYNNVGELTWLSCEVDWCNTHAGQGLDYHYHGDPFGANCMYSASDYTSTTSHPPLIGYGLDGFPIYGRYLDDTAPGYSVALDDCGGHTHSPDTNSYGYHYHSQVLTQTVTSASLGLTVGQTYTAFINGPYKCWKGDISVLPGFWTKSDYTAQCCTMNATTQAYAASGVTYKTSSSSSSPSSPSSPSSNSSSSSSSSQILKTQEGVFFGGMGALIFLYDFIFY